MVDSLHFGRFEIRPAARQLLIDGKPAVLGARAFDLLVTLVERRGSLVAKDKLLELVWPNLVVEENNLQVQVSALRRLLGPDAIATVPARGYRFCLEPVSNAAPLRPVGSTPTQRLPAERTPLIGRAAELAACAAQLQRARLLTLTGIGGTGKTRLALALAGSGDARAYRDGAVFVDLAPVSDPDRVSAAVAAATDIDERPGTPLLDVIAEQLAARNLLLVLDNCEHVLESAAALADALIGRCVELRLLATSREPLAVPGEVVHPVPPLALPEGDNLAALAASEAVQLFVDRAQRVLPSFVLDASNASAVARICCRLDGMPLAMELAAARVALLEVSQIADRLDQRFRLLTGGRDRRQQTLEAVVRWSWDHLAAAEQRVLARLSVFAGGFALETAVAVSDAVDDIELLDVLARLQAESLLVVETGGGDTRYRMLDTVREYARRRLDEMGEGGAARDRHLLAHVERTEATAELNDARWNAAFRAEVEDIVAAHAWCDRTADGAELGLRLAIALRCRFIDVGMLQLGQRISEEALARPGAQRRSRLRAWALFALGSLRFHSGDRGGARVPLEEAATLGRALEEPAPLCRALALLADLLPVRERDLQATAAMLSEAVAIAREISSPAGSTELGAALLGYGVNLYWSGEFGKAERAYEEALAIYRRLGDPANVSTSASNIVDARLSGGSDGGVRQLLLEIARAELETRSFWVGRFLIGGCMRLALYRRQWRDALVLHAAAKALALEGGLDPEPPADVPAKIAEATAALGADTAEEATAEGAVLSHAAAIAYARAWLEQQQD